MFELVFTKEAEHDLTEIGEWYKNIRVGLDLEFLMCIEAEIERIRKTPLVYKEYYSTIRKAVISKFPYSVYYELEETRIVVIAITHHKRGQKTIRKKLKKK